MNDIRALILDDDENRRKQLEEELHDEDPDIQIDTATNLADASKHMQRMALSGFDYDVGLFDAKVPLHSGPTSATDRNEPGLYPEERRKLLKLLTYRTVVINYSAFAQDPSVQKCILEELREPNGPVPVLIDTEKPWFRKVRQILRKKVYGRRIDEQVKHLLRLKAAASTERGPALRGAGAARAMGGRHGGIDLSSLAHDIKQHWRDLEADQQARVREVFNVRLVGDDVLVSL